MKIGKKTQVKKDIPTASMADIAFLLLIFFMTTTVLKEEIGLDVVYPDVEQSIKTERENTTHIWMVPIAGAKKAALTIVNDAEVKDYNDIKLIMTKKKETNPVLTIAMNVDERTPYKEVNQVMEQFRQAHTYRIYFISNQVK